eukprot:8677923-Pyramimonas_sp.AAC.1
MYIKSDHRKTVALVARIRGLWAPLAAATPMPGDRVVGRALRSQPCNPKTIGVPLEDSVLEDHAQRACWLDPHRP